MKKLFLALVVLFATSFVYVGCSSEPIDEYNEFNEKSLDKDEIDDDDI